MSLYRWLVAFLICAAVVAILGLVKYNQVMAAIAFGESFPEPSETVHTQQLIATQWQATTLLPAETVAPQLITLTNQQAGIITAVNGVAGAILPQNSVFLQIDNSEELANLEALNAQITLAQLDVERLERLIKVNASSKDQYDRAQAQLNVVTAQADALQANLAKKQVVAPFTGELGLHSLEVGQYIEANTALVSLLGRVDPIWVEVNIPQNLSALNIGSELDIYFQNNVVKGRVITKSRIADPVNRTLTFRIAIPNEARKIAPGSFVQVGIPAGTNETVYIVADTAVRYSALGSHVFVLSLDDNNQYRAVRQEVTVLDKNTNQVVIKADFAPDSVIATLGAFKLREGMWVKIAEQQ